MTGRPRPRRPAMLDPRAADELPGAGDPELRAEIAHTTAHAIVAGGRATTDPEVVARLVRLVDYEGLDTVAALWADAAPDTLPGALWRAYVLRDWVRRDPRTIAERYRLGVARAEVAGVVAGVADFAGPDEVADTLDAVLSGLYTGELDVALERAAALCRGLAVGVALDADRIGPADLATRLTRSASGLIRTAEELERAADGWRAGRLA